MYNININRINEVDCLEYKQIKPKKIYEARSRLNTVFMVTYFLGGSLGSSLGSYAWSMWKWQGVCLTGGMMIVLGFFVWGFHRLINKN